MSMGKIVDFIGGLGGRKFLVAVLAVIAVVLKEKLGVSEEQVQWVGGIAISFILGQGLADGMSKGVTATAASPVEPPKTNLP